MSERVAVIGAGSWGTAVASLVGATAPGHPLGPVARAGTAIERTRENATYLPGVAFPTAWWRPRPWRRRCDGARVVFMAVPSHGFRAVLDDLKPFASGVEAIISLSKGIETGTNLRMSEVIARCFPASRPGC